jgi:hypothetical protein
MNCSLFNAFRLEKVKRLNAVNAHSVSQLHVQAVVSFFEMIGSMKVLLAEKAQPFFTQRQTAVARTANARKPTIQQNIQNLSHNYGAKMKNGD